MNIILGNWSQEQLNVVIEEYSKISDAGGRIGSLSKQFIGNTYKESTLTGDISNREVFTINLLEFDCFTFIDTIEAMRLSSSYLEFEENLKKVRYRDGVIEFKNRNHFFTDWREFNSDFVNDVTEQIGDGKTKKILKLLNKREDGTFFIPGIVTIKREIRYIPSDSIDDVVIDRLKTGDYAGIYSEKDGLDVSHVGIIIKENNKVFLRHASSDSKHRKVIDQDFKDYISEKPGLIVLRPKNISDSN